jgi:hypothetical protein
VARENLIGFRKVIQGKIMNLDSQLLNLYREWEMEAKLRSYNSAVVVPSSRRYLYGHNLSLALSMLKKVGLKKTLMKTYRKFT